VITALQNAKRYDWRTWWTGAMRALISGGAGGVVSGLGTMGIDPEHFNLTSGVGRTLELMGIVFVFQALVHLAIFLQTHPGPDPLANGNGRPNGQSKAAAA
jgi:hypothetical protein